MSTYETMFTGFHDADETGLLDQDCAMFRIYQGTQFARFTVDYRKWYVTCLYVREGDHTGVVEYVEVTRFEADMARTFRRQQHYRKTGTALPRDPDEDDSDYPLVRVADLPESWPEDLRRFITDTVTKVEAAERGEDNEMSYRNQTSR